MTQKTVQLDDCEEEESEGTREARVGRGGGEEKEEMRVQLDAPWRVRLMEGQQDWQSWPSPVVQGLKGKPEGAVVL